MIQRERAGCKTDDELEQESRKEDRDGGMSRDAERKGLTAVMKRKA